MECLKLDQETKNKKLKEKKIKKNLFIYVKM